MPESQYPTASTAPSVDAPAEHRDPHSTADQPAAPARPASSSPEWARPIADWSAPSHVTTNGAPTGPLEMVDIGSRPAAGAATVASATAAPMQGSRAATETPLGPLGVPPGTGTAPGQARPPDTARPVPRGARARGPRRARLQLRHVDAWTVLKFSCVLSIALFFVWLITVGVLYGVLQVTGVISKINDTVTTINGTGSTPPISPGIVFGGAAIIGVVNIILFIALSTVGSVVYNLCADLVGGIEVTLSERET